MSTVRGLRILNCELTICAIIPTNGNATVYFEFKILNLKSEIVWSIADRIFSHISTVAAKISLHTEDIFVGLGIPAT